MSDTKLERILLTLLRVFKQTSNKGFAGGLAKKKPSPENILYIVNSHNNSLGLPSTFFTTPSFPYRTLDVFVNITALFIVPCIIYA